MLILNETDHFSTLQLQINTVHNYLRRETIKFFFIVEASTYSYALGIVKPDAVIRKP